MSEPTGLQLEKEGNGFVVASLGEIGGEVPYTTFMTKKSYLESNPEVLEGFTRAIQKGLDYTFSNTDLEVAKTIQNHFPDTSLDDLTEVVKRYRENDSWYKTTYITEDGFKRVEDIMMNSSELDEYVSFDDLVNNEYSKDAK